MAVIAPADVVWVILDPAGEVVLMCQGTDAEDIVRDWKRPGYRAVCLDADQVNAA
jgi:hypothetical protein